MRGLIDKPVDSRFAVSSQGQPPFAPLTDPCAPLPDDPRWTHRFATVNGLELHFVEAGSGPLVLLLHGFPEFWYAWRRQIPALAAAGFRVVAPDLRGYNLSSKPEGVSAYGVRAVVDDVRGLMTALGATEADVVGHDWGAAIAWGLAMRHPSAVRRLCVMNGPHPLRMMECLFTSSQLVRSWYMFFFQLPWLPERIARARGHALLLRAFEDLPAGRRFSPEELAAYREAFERPGALTAMIGYYRAMFRLTTAVRLEPVHAPVLVLWGADDPYLMSELAQPDPRWVLRARTELWPSVGHFIQHERPEKVNQRLIEFFGGPAERELTPLPA